MQQSKLAWIIRGRGQTKPAVEWQPEAGLARKEQAQTAAGRQKEQQQQQ